MEEEKSEAYWDKRTSAVWLDEELGTLQKRTRVNYERDFGRLDVVKASAEEVELITGEPDPRRGIEKIRRFGTSVAVTTLGQDGSLVAAGGRPSRVPAYNSDVRNSKEMPQLLKAPQMKS